MTLELTNEEREQLMACIESAIRSAPNTLQAAALLLPLANKIAEAGSVKHGNANS